MGSELENLKAFVDLVNSVVTPVNTSLQRHSEAVAAASHQINRLVEMFQAEPTRQTIIDKVREIVDEQAESYRDEVKVHDAGCASRLARHDLDDESRGKAILAEAKTEIERHIREAVKPIFALQESYSRALWTMRIVAAIGATAFGYLAWTLEHLPAPISPIN